MGTSLNANYWKRLSTLIASFVLTACSSFNHVHSDYQEHLEQAPLTASQQGQRTLIFFLIDGLPVHTTTEMLAQGRLPEIQKYFLSNKAPLYRARASFPSLTYPSIASLLTESPLSQNGIFGNTILQDGFVNFEVPANYPKLNAMIRGKNIFSRLKNKGLRAVSFDFSFFADSVASTFPTDSSVGLGILGEHYNTPDRRQLKSLELLLSETKADQWPDFIFIHLVGLDFNSHDFGPDSPQAREYLQKIDQQLKPVFRILTEAETHKQRQIIAMLSADHGFDELIYKRLDFESKVRAQDRKIRVINESRYAGIYFPPEYSEKMRSAFLRSWIANPDIDVVAIRENEQVFVKSSTVETDFTYTSQKCSEGAFAISINGQAAHCPEQLPPELNNLFYPFFLNNLSVYFRAENRPDAVVIAKPGISFAEKYRGQHGGPTPREVFVPLFIRGAKLGDPNRIPPLWELLRFM